MGADPLCGRKLRPQRLVSKAIWVAGDPICERHPRRMSRRLRGTSRKGVAGHGRAAGCARRGARVWPIAPKPRYIWACESCGGQTRHAPMHTRQRANERNYPPSAGAFHGDGDLSRLKRQHKALAKPSALGLYFRQTGGIKPISQSAPTIPKAHINRAFGRKSASGRGLGVARAVCAFAKRPAPACGRMAVGQMRSPGDLFAQRTLSILGFGQPALAQRRHQMLG